MTERRPKQIKQYKSEIHSRGGKLPRDIKTDNDSMKLAKLDSRLRQVRGKKKGPV